MGKQFYLLPWEEALLDNYYLRKKKSPPIQWSKFFKKKASLRCRCY